MSKDKNTKEAVIEDLDNNGNDLTARERERALNHPHPQCAFVQGRDRIRKVQQWGEAAAQNKNLRVVDLYCKCSNPAILERSLDSAHAADIYNLVETVPTLERVFVYHYKGLTTIVDKLLTRLASRKHNNTNENSSLLTVKLHECDFSAEALRSLLLCGQVKDLTLTSFDSAEPKLLDWKMLPQALTKSTSLESLELSLYYTRILGSSVETPCLLKSLTIDNCEEHEFGGGDETMNRADWKQNMIQFFQHTPQLGKVYFKAMHLSTSDFEAFAAGIASRRPPCTNVLLYVSLKCKLDESGCAVLSRSLQETTAVHELTVQSNFKVIDAALHGLVGNRSIQSASFSVAPFDRDDAFDPNLQMHLSQLLTTQHPTLKSLSLHHCLDKNNSYVSALFQALASNRTLSTLSVELSSLDNENTALEMERCFQENTSLTEFRWKSSIASKCVARNFVNAMKHIQARTYVTLTYPCRFMDARNAFNLLSFCADLIDTCEDTLVELSTSGHSPADASSFMALLQAVERNRTLQSLKASTPCRMPSDGVRILVDQLIQSLPRLTSLKRLDLWRVWGGVAA